MSPNGAQSRRTDGRTRDEAVGLVSDFTLTALSISIIGSDYYQKHGDPDRSNKNKDPSRHDDVLDKLSDRIGLLDSYRARVLKTDALTPQLATELHALMDAALRDARDVLFALWYSLGMRENADILPIEHDRFSRLKPEGGVGLGCPLSKSAWRVSSPLGEDERRIVRENVHSAWRERGPEASGEPLTDADAVEVQSKDDDLSRDERPTVSVLIEAADISDSTFGRIRKAAGIDTPKGRGAAHRPYSPDEVAAMIAAAKHATPDKADDVDRAWARWSR